MATGLRRPIGPPWTRGCVKGSDVTSTCFLGCSCSVQIRRQALADSGRQVGRSSTRLGPLRASQRVRKLRASLNRLLGLCRAKPARPARTASFATEWGVHPSTVMRSCPGSSPRRCQSRSTPPASSSKQQRPRTAGRRRDLQGPHLLLASEASRHITGRPSRFDAARDHMSLAEKHAKERTTAESHAAFARRVPKKSRFAGTGIRVDSIVDGKACCRCGCSPSFHQHFGTAPRGRDQCRSSTWRFARPPHHHPTPIA